MREREEERGVVVERGSRESEGEREREIGGEGRREGRRESVSKFSCANCPCEPSIVKPLIKATEVILYTMHNIYNYITLRTFLLRYAVKFNNIAFIANFCH